MADARTPRRRRPAGTAPETPQEAAPATETPTPPKPPGKAPPVLQKKLETFFVGMALPFAAAGDQHCAMILAERGPVVAEAWANLAAESPAVKRVLESMLKGGAWAGAIGSTAGMVIPIAAHHGLKIPDPITPVVMGRKKDRDEQEEAEPTVTQPPVATNGHGNGVPGPAAFSAPAQTQDADLTDPTKYAGPHNSPSE